MTLEETINEYNELRKRAGTGFNSIFGSSEEQAIVYRCHIENQRNKLLHNLILEVKKLTETIGGK